MGTPRHGRWAQLLSVCWVVLAIHCGAGPCLFAQTPLTNDVCSGATVIPAAGPFPYLTDVIPDISGASTDLDPPFPTCAISGLTNSVWFKFAPTATALYRFSTCADTATTVDDTV